MALPTAQVLTTALLLLTASSNASFLTALPKPRLDGRIVGGAEVEIKQIPFQVSLQRGYHFCGGSLIAPNFVLTAAHCTSGQIAGSIQVRLGSTHSATGGQLAIVRKIHQHAQYNGANIDYDYSILELLPYVAKNLTIGFAQLPNVNDDVDDGTLLTVSGWGNTQNSSESREGLRAVKVPKYNQQQCNTAYALAGGITERMICAGLAEGGKDACQGDSGGPLFAGQNQLVGVVSWGYGCARPNFPGVYSRVAVVRDWIKQVAGV